MDDFNVSRGFVRYYEEKYRYPWHFDRGWGGARSFLFSSDLQELVEDLIWSACGTIEKKLTTSAQVVSP
jgi:hypothetical protein